MDTSYLSGYIGNTILKKKKLKINILFCMTLAVAEWLGRRTP